MNGWGKKDGKENKETVIIHDDIIRDDTAKEPTMTAVPVMSYEFMFQFDLWDNVVIVIDAENYEAAKEIFESLCSMLQRHKLVIKDGNDSE